MDSARRKEFWSGFAGLVWSNPAADDSIMIRAALQRPRFDELLRICLEFGLDRVQEEFNLVCQDYRFEISAEVVRGMLDNINKGFQRAETEHRRNLATSPVAT